MKRILICLLVLILGTSLLMAQPATETATQSVVETVPTTNTTVVTAEPTALSTPANNTVEATEPLAASATTNNQWSNFPQDMTPPEGMELPEGFDMNRGGFQMTGEGGKSGSVGAEGTSSSTVDLSSYMESVSSPENPLTYYAAEDILDESLYTAITVQLKDGEIETSELPSDVTIEINKDGNVAITNSGKSLYNYVLSGTWNGTVMVTSKKANYMVTLDGVSITGTTLPGMQLKSEVKAFLLLKGENYVSDSKDNTKKGALTSGGDVIINGTGTLTITAYKKHGLKVDGTVRLVSGTLHAVTDVEAEGNALSIDDAYIQDGGALVIEANGSVYTSESKGVKVNGRELEENAKGYLVINGGTVDIVSVGKALTAGWKIDEDAETETTADDPTPNLIINNGVLHLTTTGTPYEYSDEESLSPEGIEAKNLLQINGGYMEVFVTDDGLNAGNAIEINGGLLFIYSRAADGIDTNGTLTINGGTVVSLGAGMPEMGIDSDSNEVFTYHGGLVIGLGGGNNTPTNPETDGCAISFYSPVSAGATLALVDESGKTVAAYQIPTWYTSGSSVMILSDDIQIGSSYQVLSNVEASSSEFFNGLYLGEVSVSGGTVASSYTVSSTITGLSGGMGGGMRGGMFDGGGKGGRMTTQNGQMPQGFDGQMPQNFDGQMPQNFGGQRGGMERNPFQGN